MGVAMVDTGLAVGVADAVDIHHYVAMEIVRGSDLPMG